MRIHVGECGMDLRKGANFEGVIDRLELEHDGNKIWGEPRDG